MIDWLYYTLLLLLLLSGWGLNAFSLPGLWVMVASSAVYGLLTGWLYLGWRTLAVLFVIALIAEVVETVAGGAGAKRAGASKKGMIGAIIGGVLGAIFLSIPLPIIGTIIGACFGSLLGASILELLGGRHPWHSLRIGYGAAKGRLVGILSKLAFGGVIFLIAAVIALPLGSAQPAPAPLPASAPATLPAA